MAMRIIVDLSLCDGNGACAAEAPLYFMLDENDELQLLKDNLDAGELTDVQRAVQSCPKAALRIMS